MSAVVKQFVLFLEDELTLEQSFIISNDTYAKQSGCEVIAMDFSHNSVVYQIMILQE